LNVKPFFEEFAQDMPVEQFRRKVVKTLAFTETLDNVAEVTDYLKAVKPPVETIDAEAEEPALPEPIPPPWPPSWLMPGHTCERPAPLLQRLFAIGFVQLALKEQRFRDIHPEWTYVPDANVQRMMGKSETVWGGGVDPPHLNCAREMFTWCDIEGVFEAYPKPPNFNRIYPNG
jgi:hypothetical protein